MMNAAILLAGALALAPVPASSTAPDGPGCARSSSSTVHGWRSGALYRLATTPGRVSDIALEPGEALIAVAAGDTSRWVIGDTLSGAGPTRRSHVLVKPTAPGLETNLVITTDRRVYHLELSSGSDAMTSIAWTYPAGRLLALKSERPAGTTAVASAIPAAVERLNFDYEISGDSPRWRPVRAFDDGARVYIEFPPSIGSTEAPPLFLVGASGKVELVNYRKRGRYYVVDQLFDAAELRLGGKRQQIVRISRGNRNRERGARGSAS